MTVGKHISFQVTINVMNNSPNKLRLKITTVIPSPYQVDLFNALSKRQDVEVEVLYWRRKTAHIFNLPTTFDHASHVLSGVRFWLPFIGWEKLCLGHYSADF